MSGKQEESSLGICQQLPCLCLTCVVGLAWWESLRNCIEIN